MAIRGNEGRGGFRRTAIAVAGILLAATPLQWLAAQRGDGLVAGFVDPPQSARPRVWWHWMNGNISRDGIAKDLAWMKRAGIGGMQNFDAGLATPQVVDKRVPYMTPEWQELFRFAAQTSRQLGLEFTIASSAGWSETGGPWVKPENGMKKLVWSETTLTGGRPVELKLPLPPSAPGPFQDISIAGGAGERDHETLPPAYSLASLSYYRDAMVLAFPDHSGPPIAQPAQALANGKPVAADAIVDQSLATGIPLPQAAGREPGTVEYVFASPQTVASASAFIAGPTASALGGGLLPRIEASDDGRQWRKVAEFRPGAVPSTISFPAITATRFRIVFASAPAPAGGGAGAGFAIAPGVDVSAMGGMGGGGGGRAQTKLAEFTLSSTPRVNAFELKAGYAIADDYYALDPQCLDPQCLGPGDGIHPNSVVNLTGRMAPDGTLRWTPPPGRWKVLRFGYSLTGKMNAPASREATGLEVDKYDADAVRGYLDTYLSKYSKALGGAAAEKGLNALLNDSIETGPSNWTPRMVEKFRTLRGYDPTPWLPTLAGVVVGHRWQSDAFLYDFRRTLGDLMTQEHYGAIAAFAHRNGLRVYGESLEGTRNVLGDDIEMRKFADIPMAALWTFPKGGQPRQQYITDIRGAASAAHLYGKTVVAAESLTSILVPWGHAPADLRPMIDMIFVNGVNRPVIHTSVHQPVDRPPGLSLGVFGQFFTRHETWAEQARAWTDYMARTSFLLQQGRNVADVGYFYGEEGPVGEMASRALSDAPSNYAYDFIPPDALLSQLSVQNGDLVARSGARYRVLYLGGTSDRMTLPVLRRIVRFVEEGATIIVGRPLDDSPSLADDRAEFARLRQRLWDGAPVTRVGRGRVIRSRDIEAALRSIGVAPDFAVTGESAGTVPFVHRALADGDAYFVVNRRNKAGPIEARFRVTGRQPEIWHADTGRREAVSYRTEGEQTVVTLPMESEESVFVLFRKPTAARAATIAPKRTVKVASLDGPWQVSFQPGRGAPASVQLPNLRSLSENQDPGIKYFSGVATYRTSFTLPQGVGPREELRLDLGKVGDLAEVWLNGRKVGTAWHAPYVVILGPGLRSGTNQLDIRVANLWVNRLIGDRQPGATKIGFTVIPTYMASAPLRASGLIGPVTLATNRP